MNVADIIRVAVNASCKSQRQIAQETGFKNANLISMLKSGVTRVPIAKVPALARALSLDPADLLLACLREYQPDRYRALAETFSLELSSDEIRLLCELRRFSGHSHIAALTDRSRHQLNEFLTCLRAESLTLLQH